MSNDDRSAEAGFLYSIANNGQFERLATYLGGNESLAVRKEAANLLTQFLETIAEENPEPVIEKLYTAALTETNETVRANIIEALIYLDDEAIETFVEKIESADFPTPTDSPHPLVYVEWLKSSHVELRLVAVAGLGTIGSEEIVPNLITACRDSDRRIQIRALGECGRIGDPRCVDVAIKRLSADDIAVRAAAANCLVNIGTKDALAAIIPFTTEGELPVRKAIISDLGKTGSLTVFGVLLGAIDSPDTQLKKLAVRSAIELIAYADSGNSHTVRFTIAAHFQQLVDNEVINMLQSVADASEPQIRRNAMWILCEIIDPTTHTEGVDRLISAIADEDKITADMTTSKLANCQEPVVIDRIEVFVKNNDLDSTALKRADYIRDRIEEKMPEDRLKDAVEYTVVNDPADYTKKHTDG